MPRRALTFGAGDPIATAQYHSPTMNVKPKGKLKLRFHFSYRRHKVLGWARAIRPRFKFTAWAALRNFVVFDWRLLRMAGIQSLTRHINADVLRTGPHTNQQSTDWMRTTKRVHKAL
jgi:hypothetical protein